MIKSVDAVLVTAVVAVFTAAGSVGFGRGVGVVGGGTMQASSLSFMIRPSWQTHSTLGSSLSEMSTQLANSMQLYPSQGLEIANELEVKLFRGAWQFFLTWDTLLGH